MSSTLMTAESRKNTILPMIIIGILFFIFGFVTWLNGSLIPFLKIICDLNDFQALFVTFAFYISYTVLAFLMASVLKLTGYRNAMALGLGIMAIGSLLFIPAALAANYMFFLVALFVLGAGLTILQTASNPYVVFIGPKESAAMRISIMGIINKTAGIIVPIVFATLILSDLGDISENALAARSAEDIRQLSERLIIPYIYMAVVLVSLIGLVYFSKLPSIKLESESDTNAPEKSNIFEYPQIILGASALFAYIGIEVISGDTIGLYGASLGVANFSTLTSYTMAFMLVGYFIGVITIPKYLSQSEALIGSAVAGCFFIICIVFSSSESLVISNWVWGWAGLPLLPDTVFFVALLGMANALVWPAIWPLALDGLGKFTAQGSALLIMSIAGGAIIPLIFGKLSETTGNMQLSYWIGIPCYLFILYYAISGHKKREW